MAGDAPRRPLRQRHRFLQNSFMSKDAMQMMKFRDLTDHYADGWSFVELLMPGVADPTWFDRWKEGLAKASGPSAAASATASGISPSGICGSTGAATGISAAPASAASGH